jgi:hypothetical protein
MISRKGARRGASQKDAQTDGCSSLFHQLLEYASESANGSCGMLTRAVGMKNLHRNVAAKEQQEKHRQRSEWAKARARDDRVHNKQDAFLLFPACAASNGSARSAHFLSRDCQVSFDVGCF